MPAAPIRRRPRPELWLAAAPQARPARRIPMHVAERFSNVSSKIHLPQSARVLALPPQAPPSLETQLAALEGELRCWGREALL